MNDKLVTLAIHTNEKAQILKRVLEHEGIEVSIDNVNLDNPGISPGVRVRIQEADLPRALNVVENRHLFGSVEVEESERVADGRKRILVPVDFSDYSLKACRIAFNLAKKIDAKVKILHVYFNPYYPTALPMADAFAYQAKEGENFQNILDKVRNDIQKLCSTIDEKIANGEFPTVNYSYVLREGLPEEEIVAFTKDYNPAMIVMGTRGKDKKDTDLIGSVTAEVIEMTRIPVLTVPENTSFYDIDQIQNIAFLTNFSQRDLISIDSMMKLFLKQDIKVHFTHISSKKEDRWDAIKLEGVKTYFAKQYPEIKAEYHVIESDISVEVDKFVKEYKIDILALNTAKRNILARMFNPSMSRKMLFHTDTPLLVLRG